MTLLMQSRQLGKSCLSLDASLWRQHLKHTCTTPSHYHNSKNHIHDTMAVHNPRNENNIRCSVAWALKDCSTPDTR